MEKPYALVVQHAAPETPGLIGHALAAKGLETRFIKSFAGDDVPLTVGAAAGLIVMGGPMGVSDVERTPYLRAEMRLLEQALGVGCPVLGVCLGSQLLAHVLGGRVTRGAQKEIGWHRVTLTEHGLLDPLLKTVESSFQAFHWHGDVFDLPPGAISLLRSELTTHQGFRFGASAYGLLCHLEVTQEIIEAMVSAFPDDLAEVRTSADEVLAGARVHLAPLAERARRIFAGWVDLAAARADAPFEKRP